jgi:hypothetical protein
VIKAMKVLQYNDQLLQKAYNDLTLIPKKAVCIMVSYLPKPTPTEIG